MFGQDVYLNQNKVVFCFQIVFRPFNLKTGKRLQKNKFRTDKFREPGLIYGTITLCYKIEK